MKKRSRKSKLTISWQSLVAANLTWLAFFEPTGLLAQGQESRTGGSSLNQLLNTNEIPIRSIPSSSDQVPSEQDFRQFLARKEAVDSSGTVARLALPKENDNRPGVANNGVENSFELKRIESNPGIHRLAHMSTEKFEQLLQKRFAESFRSVVSPDSRYLRAGVTHSSRELVMLVDRQAGLVAFEGDVSLQLVWKKLILELDSNTKLNVDHSVSQTNFFLPDNADTTALRQAAVLLGVLQEEAVLPSGTPGIQDDKGELQEKVEIYQDPETKLWIVKGPAAEVAKIKDFADALNQMVKGNRKAPKAFQLKSAQAATIEEQVKEIYDASYSKSLGTIEVKSNSINNTLVVVGFPQALEQVKAIIDQFDAPSDAQLEDNLKTIRLKFLSAVDAKSRLDLYFQQSVQGGGNVRLPSIPYVAIPDFRSNIITIKGSKQSIQEAERLLEAIDVDESDTVHEVKIVKVKNRLAEELAVIVQDAINGQQPGAGNGFKGVQQQQQQQFQQQQETNDPNRSNLPAKSLTMKTIGGNGDSISSGILFDARVSADRDSNTIIITAPSKSIPLIELLIEELDRIPDVEIQMKVFHVVNGDAAELLNTLNTLFGANQQQQQQQQGGFGQNQQQGNLFNQLPLQTAGATAGSNLVNLRFSADTRTNSIIATGPIGELQVVEALLNRLDEGRNNALVTKVYRLSNSPALDVSDAISQWLQGRDQINGTDPRAIGNLNQTNRRVVVIPEVVSNSLLIQAHPDYLEEVIEIIRGFDRRPPMVKVKVMLAEVDLNRLEEFGMDLGVQDSILFDRGTSIGAGNAITGGIGFPFNQAGVGNVNAFGRENLAGQSLSNLGTGRVNSELGYGGLVLSAGNESINILLRALQNKRCVRVLSKPQIMTIENLQGRVQVGASVPRVAGTTPVGLTVQQDIEFVPVGVILEVTPRVSPDGMIVMAVNASRSSVGPESSGITIGVGPDGTPIRSPQILQTEAQTTLMARSGQTIVFAGLIQESKSHEERGIPIISNLPVIGPLFKFESDRASRTELLIVMTPYLITDDDDIDAQNQEEMDRMHWCLEDVAEIYGSTGYHRYQGTEGATEVIYPDQNPTGTSDQNPSQDPDGSNRSISEAPAQSFRRQNRP